MLSERTSNSLVPAGDVLFDRFSMSKYTHCWGFAGLNEADICSRWCLAVDERIVLFSGLVLWHSCFKMNVGFCPSSIYFLVFMVALPCVIAVWSSLVLVVLYFTGCNFYSLLISVLKPLVQ